MSGKISVEKYKHMNIYGFFKRAEENDVFKYAVLEYLKVYI